MGGCNTTDLNTVPDAPVPVVPATVMGCNEETDKGCWCPNQSSSATVGSLTAPRCARCLHAPRPRPPQTTGCPPRRAVASLLSLPLFLLSLLSREQRAVVAAATAQPRSAARAGRCWRLLGAVQAPAALQQQRLAVQREVVLLPFLSRQACWVRPSLTGNEKVMQTS